MRPLKGGIKLEGKKDATLIPWSSARPSPPKKVRFPLSNQSLPVFHDFNSPGLTPGYRPLVQTGDHVRLGEKIAESDQKIGLHASVSGKVAEINSVIEILSDGKDEPITQFIPRGINWESLSKDELKQTLSDSGIELPVKESPKTLILNACESEPYLTSDHSLLMSHPVEILKAAEILLKVFEAKNVILVLEDNKEEVAEVMKSKIFFHTWSKTRVEVLPTRYPQEDETILISTFAQGERACVLDMATVYAVYEAVVLQKPFYERIVTISGECVAQPRNFWIRIGTSAEDAVKYARGFLRKPEKVILGGPMRGTLTPNLSVPVLKDTRAILGLPRELTRPESIEPCIRCNRCVESCPVDLSPVMITLASERGLFDLTREYDSHLCIECGNCSYVCPAKRPMVELIQYANER